MTTETGESVAQRGESPEGRFGSQIHQRFAALGGVDLCLPARAETPRRPDFAAQVDDEVRDTKSS